MTSLYLVAQYPDTGNSDLINCIMGVSFVINTGYISNFKNFVLNTNPGPSQLPLPGLDGLVSGLPAGNYTDLYFDYNMQATGFADITKAVIVDAFGTSVVTGTGNDGYGYFNLPSSKCISTRNTTLPWTLKLMP